MVVSVFLRICRRCCSRKTSSRTREPRISSYNANKTTARRKRKGFSETATENINLLVGLEDEVYRALESKSYYLPKEMREMPLGDSVVEFSGHFTEKDVKRFMTCKEHRRGAIHVYDGEYLTQMLQWYYVRKQLLTFSIV